LSCRPRLQEQSPTRGLTGAAGQLESLVRRGRQSDISTWRSLSAAAWEWSPRLSGPLGPGEPPPACAASVNWIVHRPRPVRVSATP
jgi:hypothetical protein